MIAAAATTSSLSLDHLPVGWFDGVLLAMIVWGFFRGRKHGMTKEVLPMFQWLAMVLVCGLGYEWASRLFNNIAGLGMAAACVWGYLSLAFAVSFLFLLLKQNLMPKLTGSNFFGSMEYYLGAISGVIRFVCMTFFALALLHAPHYSAADIAAASAYNARWYGGGQQGYSGNYFPTLQSVQEEVFQKSFIGGLTREYLSVMLISPGSVSAAETPAAKKPIIHIGN